EENFGGRLVDSAGVDDDELGVEGVAGAGGESDGGGYFLFSPPDEGEAAGEVVFQEHADIAFGETTGLAPFLPGAAYIIAIVVLLHPGVGIGEEVEAVEM